MSNYGSGFNWVDISKANNLNNPGVLLAGQRLVIPKAEVKTLTAVTTPVKTSGNENSGRKL